MQILIRVIPEKEPEHAEFYVHCKDQAIERLVEYVEQERYHSMMLTCYRGDEIVKVKESVICFIETVQEKQLVHTAAETLEVKKRLYELEHLLPAGFIRISKSVIINMDRVSAYRPMVNGLMEVSFPNNRTVYISRKYLKDVRSQIMEVRNERKSCGNP